MGPVNSLLLSEDKDVFLIGKSGSGKSSTANTLVRRKGFDVSDAASSATTHIEVQWTKYGDYTLKVVDGPGTFDTRYNEEENMTKAVAAFADAFSRCPDGFHALVLVLKYGVRFTSEEQKTVTILKRMFGFNFLQNYGIVVFTDGENFDLNNKDKTFEAWCSEQTGALGNLLQECRKRVVLFRNLQAKSHVKSLEKMLTLLEDIPSRYTNGMFEAMKHERLKLIVETKERVLTEDIQKRLSIITGNITAIKESINNPREQMRSIEQLKTEAIRLQEEVYREDQGTGVLSGLKKLCSDLLKQIDSDQNRNINFYEEQLKNIRQEQEKALAASLEQREKFISILERAMRELKMTNSECNRNVPEPLFGISTEDQKRRKIREDDFSQLDRGAVAHPFSASVFCLTDEIGNGKSVTEKRYPADHTAEDELKKRLPADHTAEDELKKRLPADHTAENELKNCLPADHSAEEKLKNCLINFKSKLNDFLMRQGNASDVLQEANALTQNIEFCKHFLDKLNTINSGIIIMLTKYAAQAMTEGSTEKAETLRLDLMNARDQLEKFPV